MKIVPYANQQDLINASGRFYRTGMNGHNDRNRIMIFDTKKEAQGRTSLMRDLVLSLDKKRDASKKHS